MARPFSRAGASPGPICPSKLAAPAFPAQAATLPPAAPTSVTATYVALDAEVDVAWVDASADETSFVIERCQAVGCTSFTVLTTWPAVAGTGGHPWYADCTGLLPGYTYIDRVGAERCDKKGGAQR